jgi:hypothetical protein
LFRRRRDSGSLGRETDQHCSSSLAQINIVSIAALNSRRRLQVNFARGVKAAGASRTWRIGEPLGVARSGVSSPIQWLAIPREAVDDLGIRQFFLAIAFAARLRSS